MLYIYSLTRTIVHQKQTFVQGIRNPAVFEQARKQENMRTCPPHSRRCRFCLNGCGSSSPSSPPPPPPPPPLLPHPPLLVALPPSRRAIFSSEIAASPFSLPSFAAVAAAATAAAVSASVSLLKFPKETRPLPAESASGRGSLSQITRQRLPPAEGSTQRA